MSQGWSVVKAGDVPDPSGDHPGELRMLTRALEAEQVALTYRVIGAGASHFPMPGAGHRHRTQEEVYFVASGEVRFRLGDDEVEVGPLTAVRVAPETARELRNDGDTDAVVLIVSTRVEDLRSEAEIVPDFWPAD